MGKESLMASWDTHSDSGISDGRVVCELLWHVKDSLLSSPL